MLQAIAGHDPDDPTTSRRPVPDYRAGLRRGRGGLRLAVGGRGPRRRARCGGRGRRRALRCGRAEPRPACRRAPVRVQPFDPLNALRRVDDAGRMRGAPPRAGAGAARRLQPADRGADGARLRAVRRRLSAGACPRARRCCERFCAEAFADADVLALPTTPGGDAADRGHRHRRRRPLRRGRQSPRRPARPDQLSGPAGAQPADRARLQRACRSACSWWRGRSPRPCCSASPTRSRRRPAMARSRRRSPEPEPCRQPPRPARALARAARHPDHARWPC